MASVAVVLSWVPQVRRILVTRKAEDISFGLPVLLIVGSTLWIAYGIHLADIIIIVVNAIVTLLNVLILLLKKRYGT